MHLETGLGGCHTFVISLAGLMTSCGTSSLIPRVIKSFSTVSIPTQINVDYRQRVAPTECHLMSGDKR
eukprot:12777325-Ditylum_brightwellii.AAC.1